MTKPLTPSAAARRLVQALLAHGRTAAVQQGQSYFKEPVQLMGVYAAEKSASEFDAIAHQTATAKAETRKMREHGLKQALAERDGSFRKP